FVDVKDSTEMIQRLDTSDWKSVIAQAHARIAALVSQWGGQIGQYLGDGVMCFFGARHSQGSDAINAVSCGLAIQKSIAEYAGLVAEQYEQIEFSMRLGISTGKLVVGLMGEDQKREFLALGPATNRAARLQGIAAPGQVYIDEATYARVRHHFVMLPQAPAHLKGFEEAIKVYQVVGHRSRPAQEFAATDIRGIYVPLMGRDQPLTLVDYRIDQIRKTHQGHMITALGDIGVGKSRLLHAISQRIEQQFRILRLGTSYEARLRRYNLLVESLDSYGYGAEDTHDAEVRQLLIARAESIVDDPISALAAKAIMNLADGNIAKDDDTPAEYTTQWLAKVAEQQPLLILVDNLQWADADSVRFLETLAQALREKPALIIAAARLDFLTAYPDFLQNNAQHTRIMLDPLQEADARLLIDSVLQHVKGVPAALVDALLERSEGNPLFIHEYLTMLFDQNLVEQDDEGIWRFNIRRYNDALNALPHGLISMLQARLDELQPEARQALQVASVMGNVFWQNAVQDLMHLPGIENWLSLLTTQGIITADTTTRLNGQTQYGFRYKLYHDVAYEMIPRAQRLRYHQQFAEWLLLHANGQAIAYPLLAEQFAQGEQYAASLYTYQEAVEDRLQQEDPQHALELIDKGLGLASHLPRSEALPIVCKLWMYRGRALCILQRYDEASAAAQSALMLTREMPEDQFLEVRALAEMVLSSAFTATGRYTDAQQALKRADQLLPTEATGLRSMLALRTGILAEEQGQFEVAEVSYYRAFLQAEAAGNQRYLAMSQQHRGALALEQGHFAEALTIFRGLLNKEST
ncbi:MAG: AAA family ATPase, partial [Anaerolineae bacterium]|nr:AAA family ATPase [Anaerolineae bacterium]